MRKYEIMFIVDPNVSEEEIDQVNTQVEGLITEAGGQVESVEKLGRKKLAYEVQRHSEGFYVLFRVVADGGIVKEVERRFRVMDSVLRYLTVRVDDLEKKLEKMTAIRSKKASQRGSSTATRGEPTAQSGGPSGDGPKVVKEN